MPLYHFVVEEMQRVLTTYAVYSAADNLSAAYKEMVSNQSQPNGNVVHDVETKEKEFISIVDSRIVVKPEDLAIGIRHKFTKEVYAAGDRWRNKEFSYKHVIYGVSAEYLEKSIYKVYAWCRINRKNYYIQKDGTIYPDQDNNNPYFELPIVSPDDLSLAVEYIFTDIIKNARVSSCINAYRAKKNGLARICKSCPLQLNCMKYE